MLPATGTPVLATFTSGLAAAVAALVIRLEVLVEMMSIGKSIRCVKTVVVGGLAFFLELEPVFIVRYVFMARYIIQTNSHIMR